MVLAARCHLLTVFLAAQSIGMGWAFLLPSGRPYKTQVGLSPGFLRPDPPIVAVVALMAKSREKPETDESRLSYRQREMMTERSRSKGKYTKARQGKMGTLDGEEYDLDAALAANTDDTITKIIAGAFIAVMIALLVNAILIPNLVPTECVTASGETVLCSSGTGREF
uniref:Uncharacterized protein n=1 Tax=Octactis speculum TaxID=3111310 RepID=A0A7S2DW16_9STRA|mmetsp:Transcript_55182/g.75418  ORF Transcript_55182/g.75418 Transcript_55182/m.75418 type:complete len:168 (+) Transcript_55182:124-627(+)